MEIEKRQKSIIKIAIYGKGGIGKSTTASNLSAALAKKGLKVMQIGCDPKADSTRNLCGLKKMPTVLDMIRAKGSACSLTDIVIVGEQGVLCVESGGPTPGIGCAGRGIITAFDKLEELDAFAFYQPDIVIYDVLGDVVCGGFAMPLRNGYADEVFVVTSGEEMALYAAENIACAIANFRSRGYAGLAGLILNERKIERESEIVAEFAERIGTRIVKVIPRHPDVQRAEDRQKTVIESFPESEISSHYCELAEIVLKTCCQRGRKID